MGTQRTRSLADPDFAVVNSAGVALPVDDRRGWAVLLPDGTPQQVTHAEYGLYYVLYQGQWRTDDPAPFIAAAPDFRQLDAAVDSAESIDRHGRICPRHQQFHYVRPSGNSGCVPCMAEERLT